MLGELTVVVFLEWACTQGERCQVRHSMLTVKSQVGVGTSRSSLVQSQPLPRPAHLVAHGPQEVPYRATLVGAELAQVYRSNQQVMPQ